MNADTGTLKILYYTEFTLKERTGAGLKMQFRNLHALSGSCICSERGSVFSET